MKNLENLSVTFDNKKTGPVLCTEPMGPNRELYARSDFSDDLKTAVLYVSVQIPERRSVRVFLLDGGRRVPLSRLENGDFTCEVASPRLWSPEDPYLYRIAAVPEDSEDACCSTGFCFRSVAADGKSVLLNGRPLILHAVSYCTPDTGTAPASARDRIREDLCLLKRLNLNAVIIRRHPVDPALYDLCNELGLLITEEPGSAPSGLILRRPRMKGQGRGEGRIGYTDLVSADNRLSPMACEIKKNAQPVSIEALSLKEGRFLLRNHQLFSDLSAFDLRYVLEAEDTVLQQRILPAETAVQASPGESREFTLPLNLTSLPKKNVTLTVSLLLKDDCAWADSGHEVAYEQFVVKRSAFTAASFTIGPVRAARDGGHITIFGQDFFYSMDDGVFTQLEYGGQDFLLAPMTPNYFHETEGAGRLRKAIHSQKALSCSVKETGERAVVEVVWGAPGLQSASTLYTVFADGRIRIRHQAVPRLPQLQRVGLRLPLPPLFDTVCWYGRGPQENDRDRRAGAKLGLYRMPVADLSSGTLPPEASAVRSDVKWLILYGSESNRSLRVSSRQQDDLYFRAQPYTAGGTEQVLLTIDGARPDGTRHLKPFAAYEISCLIELL